MPTIAFFPQPGFRQERWRWGDAGEEGAMSPYIPVKLKN